MESMNTYTLLLENNYTNEIHTFTIKNISTNDMFYEFEGSILDDLPDGEYNYYLLWNTYSPSQYQIEFSNDILSSKITVNNQTFTLRDLKPETGILKIVNSNPTKPNYIEQKTSYLAYEQN